MILESLTNDPHDYLITIARPHPNSRMTPNSGRYMVIANVPGTWVQYADTMDEAREIAHRMKHTERQSYRAFKESLRPQE